MQTEETLDDFVGTIVYDNRLDSYASFFDHDWAKSFSALTKGTVVDEAAFDLCQDWKGAGLTGRMPWLHVTALSDLLDSYIRRERSTAVKLLDALATRIPIEMSRNLSRARQRELHDVILRLKGDVEALLGGMPAMSPTAMWEDYLKIEEFGWSLGSSQRLCYAAVYYGYENFLRQITRDPEQADDDRRGIKEVATALGGLIGPGLASTSVFDPAITLARLVRNAIVHNGGRGTAAIRKDPGATRIEGDRLQIWPGDTKALFDLLKERVLSIAKAAINRVATTT